MSKTEVITHRGLQPTRKDHPFEQSLEALQYQIGQGWGLEFDPNFTKDKNVGRSVIVMHDAKLGRFTEGKDQRAVREVPFAEMTAFKLPGGFTVPTLHDVFSLIETHKAGISALHLKGIFQEGESDIDLLLAHIKEHPGVVDRMMIFDVKPEHARYMLEKIPGLILAPSIAHPYDIERFNELVQGTLFSVEDALRYGPQGEKLYKWVWGDEWDLRTKEQDEGKKLYIKKIFDSLKESGYKIALVTPELHGQSPGRYEKSAHQDATPDRLFDRIKEILEAGPDAVCTDYPEEVQTMITAL